MSGIWLGARYVRRYVFGLGGGSLLVSLGLLGLLFFKGFVMCNSCEKELNGRNGNGYQPCGCRPKKPSEQTINPLVIEEGFGLDAKETLLVFIFVGVIGLVALCVS